MSFLQFAVIPWCFQFVIGLFVQSVWILPVWLLLLLQIANGLACMSLHWIPITSAGVLILFIMIQIISIVQFVCWNGYAIRLYKQNAGLLTSVSMLGGMLFDVFIAFTGSAFFSSSVFLYAGFLIIVGSFCVWILPLNDCKPNVVPLPQVTRDCFHQSVPILLVFIAFLSTSYSSSLLFSFVDEIFVGESILWLLIACWELIRMFSLAFGYMIFLPIAYRFLMPWYYVLEIIAILLVMFLDSSSSITLTFILVLLHSFSSGLGESLVQTFCIDAAAHTSEATFLFSAFQSLSHGAFYIDSFCVPLIRSAVSWLQFYGIGIGILGLLMFVAIGLELLEFSYFLAFLSCEERAVFLSTPSIRLPSRCCLKSPQPIQSSQESEQNRLNPSPRPAPPGAVHQFGTRSRAFPEQEQGEAN